jgi:aminopeptidase N
LVDAPFGWNRPNYVPLFGGGRVSVHEMAHYWWIGAFKSVKRRAFDWFTEGFATYSEALYEEYKKGNPAYHARIWGNLMGYLMSFESKIDPNDPGKTLLKVPDSATRYRKGACVLHALRFVVGEDNFLEILRKFIAEYRGKDISVAKFREVSEKVYGKELGWFFDQWLERAGLPDYKLIVDRIESMPDGKSKVIGRIKQLSKLYKMPLEIVIKMEDKQKSERIWVEGKVTPFEIVAPQKPVSVELDPSHWILRYDIKESPGYRIGEFVLKKRWGKKSSEEIAGKYSKEWLEQLNDQFSLKRIAFALYDVKRYEEALDAFRKVADRERALGSKPGSAIFLIWQGHMLDLLGRREEALSRYQKVVDMKVTDSRWSTGVYGLSYKPSISGYAAERLKEPFKRLENRYKD